MSVLDISVWTDKGAIRTENQDGFAVRDLQHNEWRTSSQCWSGRLESAAVLVAVADGVGGGSQGGRASQLALATLGEECQRGWEEIATPNGHGANTSEQIQTTLDQATQLAHRKLLETAQETAEGRPTCTTLSALCLNQGRVTMVHVGDSRVYRWRAGEIEQISTDHSHVQRLVEMGVINAEEARSRPDRNVLLRALGFEETLRAQFWQGDLQAEDRFLLCSDGLHHYFPPEELRTVLAPEREVSDLAEWLIEEANRRGGEDNITAAVVRVAAVDCAN